MAYGHFKSNAHQERCLVETNAALKALDSVELSQDELSLAPTSISEQPFQFHHATVQSNEKVGRHVVVSTLSALLLFTCLRQLSLYRRVMWC